MKSVSKMSDQELRNEVVRLRAEREELRLHWYNEGKRVGKRSSEKLRNDTKEALK